MQKTAMESQLNRGWQVGATAGICSECERVGFTGVLPVMIFYKIYIGRFK